MYTNVMTREERNNHIDASRIVKADREEKQRVKTYYLIQRLCGLLLSVMSVIVPYILKGDTAALLVLLPIGLYLMFTKEKVMNW